MREQRQAAQPRLPELRACQPLLSDLRLDGRLCWRSGSWPGLSAAGRMALRNPALYGTGRYLRSGKGDVRRGQEGHEHGADGLGVNGLVLPDPSPGAVLPYLNTAAPGDDPCSYELPRCRQSRGRPTMPPTSATTTRRSTAFLTLSRQATRSPTGRPVTRAFPTYSQVKVAA